MKQYRFASHTTTKMKLLYGWIIFPLAALATKSTVLEPAIQKSSRGKLRGHRRAKPPNRRLRKGKTVLQNGHGRGTTDSELENDKASARPFTDGLAVKERDSESTLNVNTGNGQQQPPDWAKWGSLREGRAKEVNDVSAVATEKPAKEDWQHWGKTWTARDRNDRFNKNRIALDDQNRKEEHDGTNNGKLNNGGDTKRKESNTNEQRRAGGPKGQRNLNERLKGNIFVNGEAASEMETGNWLTEAEQTTRASLGSLENVDLSFNNEWTHTFVLDDDKKTKSPKTKFSDSGNEDVDGDEAVGGVPANKSVGGEVSQETNDEENRTEEQGDTTEESQISRGKKKDRKDEPKILDETVSAQTVRNAFNGDLEDPAAFSQFSWSKFLHKSDAETISSDNQNQLPTFAAIPRPATKEPTMAPLTEEPIIVQTIEPSAGYPEVPHTKDPQEEPDTSDSYAAFYKPDRETITVPEMPDANIAAQLPENISDFMKDEENFAWEDTNEDGSWIDRATNDLDSKARDTESPTVIQSTTPSSVPTLYPTDDRKNCNICSHGLVPLNPDRKIVHNKKTCAEVAGELDFSPAASCSDLKAELPIDLEAYCGCEGAVTTSWCKFCPNGTTNLYGEVSIPSLNGMTCKDVEYYAAFITDKDACLDLEHLSKLCCGTMEGLWRR